MSASVAAPMDNTEDDLRQGPSMRRKTKDERREETNVPDCLEDSHAQKDAGSFRERRHDASYQTDPDGKYVHDLYPHVSGKIAVGKEMDTGHEEHIPFFP